MKITGTILFLVMSLGVAGCGGPSSVVAPSRTTPVGQQIGGSVSGIRGFVLDSGFRAVPGARVEVVDGQSAGASTTTDASGQFSLAGTFTSTDRFRAIKDGYVTATQPWNCSIGASCPGANPWLGFYLAPLAQPVNIAGDYTLTFTADAACPNLPPEARVRSYPATIAPSQYLTVPANTLLHVTVGGGSFLDTLNGFDIGVAGDYLGFSLDGGHDPTIVEQLAPNTYLAFSGSAAASVGTPPASTISTSFDGWIDYCVMPSPIPSAHGYYNCGTSNTTGEPIPGAAVVYAHCESKAHRLTLTRR